MNVKCQEHCLEASRWPIYHNSDNLHNDNGIIRGIVILIISNKPHMFYSFQSGYSDVIIICNNDIKERRKVTLEFGLKV